MSKSAKRVLGVVSRPVLRSVSKRPVSFCSVPVRTCHLPGPFDTNFDFDANNTKIYDSSPAASTTLKKKLGWVGVRARDRFDKIYFLVELVRLGARPMVHDCCTSGFGERAYRGCCASSVRGPRSRPRDDRAVPLRTSSRRLLVRGRTRTPGFLRRVPQACTEAPNSRVHLEAPLMHLFLCNWLSRR